MDFHLVELVGIFPPVVRYLIIIFVIIPVVIKMIRNMYELNEGFVWKKSLSRLEYLSKFPNIDPDISSYLDSLRNEEIFRLASGIDGSNNYSKMWMKIYSKGFVTKRNLKRISDHIELGKDDKVKISPSCLEKCFFAYSLILSRVFLVFGIAAFLYYTHYLTWSYAIVGFIFALVLLILATFVSGDYTTSRILDKVQRRLKKHGMLEEPETKIYFSIFKWFYK
jgi:hypothetical protein